MSAPSVPDSVSREEFLTAGELARQWEGPFAETDRDGRPTGYYYVECADCGRQVLTSGRENLDHGESCEFGGEDA